MKNQYETVFILTPVLSDDQMKDAAEKFKKIITDNGCDLVADERWGLRKLAYEIEHKKTGFYVLYEFKAEPSFIETLETEFRRDERIMRYMTIKMDKYHIDFAERRRAGEFKKSKESKEEEANS